MSKRFINIAYRAFICMLALTMVLPGIAAIPAAAVETVETNPNEAWIVFSDELETTNVAEVELTSTTMATPAVVDGGKKVWKFSGSGLRPYLYIDLPDSFGNSLKDGSSYDVEIKYFDSDTGYAIIWYDAAKWGKQIAYELYATATSSWKTAKFTLDNAAFSGGVDRKGDIMLSFKEYGRMLPTTPFPVNIASIKITRRPSANPVIAESYVDRYGNVFEYYNKDKTVHNEIRNTSKTTQNVNIEYSLIDAETGDKVFSKTEKLAIPAQNTIKRDVNIDSERCGLYNWYVNITNDDGSISSEFKEDTIAIVKTDPNGIKSDFSGIQAHSRYFRSKDGAALIELAATANFGSIRYEELNWQYFEPTPGKYVMRDNAQSNTLNSFKQMKDLGLDILMLFYGGHWYYEGLPNGVSGIMPKTEKSLDAYEKYLEFAIPYFAPYVDKYEIWNEPNILAFNKYGGKPEDLTEITKRARKVIDKCDPDSTVFGMALTEIARDDALEWRDGMLEAGVVDGDKGMNGLSIHTYHHTYAPEDAKMYLPAIEWANIVNEYAEKTNAGNIPVYVTEYGVSTPDANTDEEKKTNWQVRDMILYKAHGAADRMYLHQMEQQGIIDQDHEDSFGLVSPPKEEYSIEGKTCVATAPYVAYAAANYIFGGEVTADGVWELDNNVYMNRFKSNKFDKNILTLWCNGGRESLTLDLGVDSVDYYDRWGNKRVIYGKDGRFTFVVDDRPSYVIGNFKENRVTNYAPVVEYDKLEIPVCVNDKVIVTLKGSNTENYDALMSNDDVNATEHTAKFEDGKVELIGDVIEENTDKKTFVDVSVTENGKLISYAQLPVKISERINSELKFELAEGKNYDNWNGIISLTNNSSGRDVDGYIQFIEPSEFAELGKIDIGNLPKLSSKDVVVNIPNLVKKGYKNITYKVVDEQSEDEPLEFSLRYDFNIAVKSPTKVVIDGRASEGEWVKNISMDAKAPENFVALTGFKGVDAEDKSANVSIMWDEDNIYMYTEVVDDIYYQDQEAQNSWSADGIQFALWVDIGEAESVAFGQPDRQFHEYALAISPTTGKVGIYKHIVQDDKTQVGEVNYATAAAVRKGKVTTYEWSMPWEKIVGIDGWSPEVGKKLGFSILWNDNDGKGRKGWVEYASGIGAGKDKKLFTNLLFIE